MEFYVWGWKFVLKAKIDSCYKLSNIQSYFFFLITNMKFRIIFIFVPDPIVVPFSNLFIQFIIYTNQHLQKYISRNCLLLSNKTSLFSGNIQGRWVHIIFYSFSIRTLFSALIQDESIKCPPQLFTQLILLYKLNKNDIESWIARTRGENEHVLFPH